MMTIIKILTGATIGTLAACSVANMSQTYMIMSPQWQQQQQKQPPQQEQRILTDSKIASINDIRSMKRKELLELFAESDVPDFDLAGEWQAAQLDNNGWIMTNVASVITHRLWGKNRRWDGKLFDSVGVGGDFDYEDNTDKKTCSSNDNNDNNTCSRQGRNIFTASSSSSSSVVQHDHIFQFQIEPSRIDNRKSLLIRYDRHQPLLSPWRSMVDEIRMVRLNNDDGVVLLGLGSIGWIGGPLNSAPFCLWRSSSSSTS